MPNVAAAAAYDVRAKEGRSRQHTAVDMHPYHVILTPLGAAMIQGPICPPPKFGRTSQDDAGPAEQNKCAVGGGKEPLSQRKKSGYYFGNFRLLFCISCSQVQPPTPQACNLLIMTHVSRHQVINDVTSIPVADSRQRESQDASQKKLQDPGEGGRGGRGVYYRL